MFQGVLGGAGELVELGLLAFKHLCLCVKVGLYCFVFVATAGYVALLLIKLQFALLDSGFSRLYFGQALVGLLFGFGFYL